MSGKQLRVFISHGFKDIPHAGLIYNQLKQEEWIAPWLDTENLQPAQDWMFEILKALHSSNVGLICLSKNTLPLTGQFKREIHEMLDMIKTHSPEQFQILTLRLDDAPLPEELASHPSVDSQGIVNALRKIMENQ